MLPGHIRDLIHDERGGATVWSLTWFMLFVGICGLSVDITDGFRAQTMLQATADSAALAGAIELPDPDAATATAVGYSERNLPPDDYGSVLTSANVELGSWDMETHIFGPAAVVPDAVRVTVRRTAETDNAVPVNFLRIIGLRSWDVTVHAIAQRFIPDCLTDGLLARGLVDISSNNGFGGDMCVHGQKGVQMQIGNTFEPGVRVTMPDPSSDLTVPGGNVSANPGLADALGEDILDPRMVNHVDEIMDDLLALENYVRPDYIPANATVETRDETWNFADAEAGHVYHIACAANKNAGIPSNATLDRVVIVADCNIGVGSGVVMTDVVLASRSGGNPGGGGESGAAKGRDSSGHGGSGVSNANINFSSNVQLGRDDGCAEGGGVQIFSNASAHFSSTMTLNGVQVVAAGDVDLGARDQGINGINVQAGGNITLTSQNMFGLCSGGAPTLFTVNYYRLVY
jgi:hypothetical protein